MQSAAAEGAKVDTDAKKDEAVEGEIVDDELSDIIKLFSADVEKLFGTILFQ